MHVYKHACPRGRWRSEDNFQDRTLVVSLGHKCLHLLNHLSSSCVLLQRSHAVQDFSGRTFDQIPRLSDIILSKKNFSHSFMVCAHGGQRTTSGMRPFLFFHHICPGDQTLVMLGCKFLHSLSRHTSLIWSDLLSVLVSSYLKWKCKLCYVDAENMVNQYKLFVVILNTQLTLLRVRLTKSLLSKYCLEELNEFFFLGEDRLGPLQPDSQCHVFAQELA